MIVNTEKYKGIKFTCNECWYVVSSDAESDFDVDDFNFCPCCGSELKEEYKQDSTKDNQGWIPCSERLPVAEVEVLIITKRKFREDVNFIMTTAMYEDGTVRENDSCWSWYEIEGEWDEEEDCYIIPEGWWENKHYNQDECYNNIVDDEVIAWQPLPEPYNPSKPNSLDKVSQEPKTRIEHIRSMSVEEMADAILERDEINIAIGYCHNFEECWEGVTEDECKKCLIEYLNSPVEPKKEIPTDHFTERFSKVL